MAFTLSRDIEDALWRAAEAVLPARVLGSRSLERAIIERSRRYTSERESADWLAPVPAPGRDPADVAAHALFFTVADAPKVVLPLAELDRRGLLAPGASGGQDIRIVDLGAGAGAMTLGAVDYLLATGALGQRGLEVRALDRDQRALAIMQRALADIAAHRGVRIALTVETGDIVRTHLAAGRADLVLAGSVLNELGADTRLPVTRAMLAAARPDGAVILIEPALRETARSLHELRDQLIETGAARVFAPCIRTAAPCPALERPDDWCHEDRPTSLPPRAARLASLTGLRTHGLKFAYLTLRHQAAAQVEVTAADPGGTGAGDRVALRLVSQAMRSKGKRECYACGERGRVLVRLLRKQRGPDTRAFERAHRGDVVVVPERLSAGGDIASGDAVEVVGTPAPGTAA